MSSPTSPAHIGGIAWAHGGCSQAHTAVQPLADGVAASSAVPVKKSDALEVLAVPSVRLWRLPSSLKDSAGKAPRSVAPSSSPLANTWMSPANSTRHRTTAKLGYWAEASLATAALRMPSESAPGRRTLAPVALKERLYPTSPPCPKTDCPAPEQSTHLHARTCAQGLETRVASPDTWGCSLWAVGLQRLACRVATGLEPSAHMLPGAAVESNSARANGGAPAGCSTTQNSMPAELLGLLCTAAAACRQDGTVAPGARCALSAPKRTAARPLSAACRSSVGPLVQSALSARWLPAGLLPCQSTGGRVVEGYRSAARSRSR